MFAAVGAVGRVGRPGLAGAGAHRATLALDFMNPGVLDARITFTRASTATYTDISGTIQTAATNAPRWDYDPVTHALRGVLIEEARTNIEPSSIAYTGWVQSGSLLTAASGTAPDGTNTMSRFTESATSQPHYISHLNAVPASTMCSYSIFAKAGQVRYLQLFFDNGGTSGGYATFDLLSGVVSGPFALSGGGILGGAIIQAIGQGIWRCSLSVNITSTGSRAGCCLSISASPGFAPTYAGNAANGLLIWGAQLEQGAFPTSYIPTTAAAVTRAADVASMPPANMSPWFTPPGGSWFVEFIAGCPPLNGRTPRLIANPSVAASAAPLYFGQGGQIGQYDIASTIETAIGLGAVGSVNKAVCTWAPGAAKACVNAGVVASTAAMTTGYALLSGTGVGILSGVPTETMTGYIRRVSYWPRALSDAEMQAVTA